MGKSEQNKYVDTSKFPEAIESIETMARSMETLVNDFNDYKAAILKNWAGDGRNQFEKSYNVLIKKLEDGRDITWDMYENLIAVQETLEQADVDIANAELEKSGSTGGSSF